MKRMLAASWLVVGWIAAVVAVPPPAHACSWLGKAIYSASPSDGETDVPLDVAPLIRGYWSKGSVVWETLDGERVEFDMTIGTSAQFTEGQTAELEAREPLAPNTTYVIRAFGQDGNGPDRIEFTTGSRMSDDGELRAPELAASFLTKAGNGCAPGNVVGCISIGESPALIEVIGEDGEVLIRDVVAGNATVWPIQEPHCIRAYARNAAGRVSEATELCTPDLPSRDLGNEPRELEPMCRAGIIGSPDEWRKEGRGDGSEGCSASGAVTDPSAWLVLGWLASLRAFKTPLRSVRRRRTAPRSDR